MNEITLKGIEGGGSEFFLENYITLTYPQEWMEVVLSPCPYMALET